MLSESEGLAPNAGRISSGNGAHSARRRGRPQSWPKKQMVPFFVIEIRNKRTLMPTNCELMRKFVFFIIL